MRLNDKGQCPACLRKPIPYKRDRFYFCVKCDRSFGMADGTFQPNWAWASSELRVCPMDHKPGTNCDMCDDSGAVTPAVYRAEIDRRRRQYITPPGTATVPPDAGA